MKHRWFAVGLVLSLTFNAGALRLFMLTMPKTVRRLRKGDVERFNSSAEQHRVEQMDRLSADLRDSLVPSTDTMRSAIKELGRLALEPEPDSLRVDAILDRIAWAKRENSRLFREWTRAELRLSPPNLVEISRNHMKAELDSALRAESSRVSAPRERR